MLVLLFVVFNGFLVISLAAPPTEHNGRTFRNALNQQSLQTILQSIEERLRNLDQVYSVRYASPTINTDPYIRKLEILETKLSRMESQVEIQLEKISENMSSKNFKDDIAKDQVFRKIDSVYERINHKLSYVEGKLDMDILKLQTKLEAGISKIERLDHSFSVRQADMEAEISDAVEMMESVRNNVVSVENKLINMTKNAIETTLDKQTNLVHAKFDNVTNQIAEIDKKINNSFEQCNQKDFLNDYTNKDTHITKTFKGYEDQIQKYGNKVNNMYDELWKKSTTIENTIKNSVLLMNLTRKEIQDLKKSGHKFTTYNDQNDGQLEIIVDSITNTIQRKFAELGRKLENNFENVMLVQNLFLESCHRIQMDESQLENKISLVLEKLLDAVTNRSINTFKEIQSMETLIKSHDANVYRTMNQNTNTIIKLSEKTSEDRKKLEKVLSTIKKDIGNALETIQNEISSQDEENSQKFDTIASILLELQEQVNDLDNRVNEDNINYNAKQILQDILLLTKDLPDKDTFAEKLNSTILHNVQDLSKLMSRVYHLLTSIDTKINKSYSDYHPSVNNRRVNATFLEDIINNTEDHANITNFSVEENEKLDGSNEVTEPVDVVLEILPERNDKKIMKNTSLSRFNYSLITDNNTNPFYDYGNGDINDYIPVTEKFKIQNDHNKNNGIHTDILEPVTMVNNNKYLLPLIDDDDDSGIVINGNDNIYVPTTATVIPTKIAEKKNIKDDKGVSKRAINGLINSYLNKNYLINDDSGIVINGNDELNIPTASTGSSVILNEEKADKKSIKIKNDYGIVINGLNPSELDEKYFVPNKNEDVPTTSTVSSVTLNEEKADKKPIKIKNDYGIVINGLIPSELDDKYFVPNKNEDVPTTSTVSSLTLNEEKVDKKSIKIKNDYGIIINGLNPSKLDEKYFVPNKNEDVPTASTVSSLILNEEKPDKKSIKIKNDYGIVINGLNPSELDEKYFVPNKNKDAPTASTVSSVILNEEKADKISNKIKDDYDGIVINGLTPSELDEKYFVPNLNEDVPTASTVSGVILIEEKSDKKPNKIKDDSDTLIKGQNSSGLNEKHSTPNKNEENTHLKIENANKNVYYVTDSATDIPINNKNDRNSKPGYTHRENDTSVQNKNDISIKGFENSASKSENKNKNNAVIIKDVYKILTEAAENLATELPGVTTEMKDFSDVIISSTVADIPISDPTSKSVKIESVTKETTELLEEPIDGIIENSTNTAQMQNSFEYTDLKNNTNDEHIRDEYEWDYED